MDALTAFTESLPLEDRVYLETLSASWSYQVLGVDRKIFVPALLETLREVPLVSEPLEESVAPDALTSSPPRREGAPPTRGGVRLL